MADENTPAAPETAAPAATNFVESAPQAYTAEFPVHALAVELQQFISDMKSAELRLKNEFAGGLHALAAKLKAAL